MNAKNVVGVIVGILIGLIVPISIKIAAISNGSINLLQEVYFLGKLIPFFAIGYLLTDFIILFLAGFLVSLISKQVGIKLLLITGVIVPLVATAMVFNGSMDMSGFFVNLVLATVYVLLGGKFYQKMFNGNSM